MWSLPLLRVFPLSVLLPLLLVLASSLVIQCQLLSFTLRTSGAGWSPRSESNVEFYPHSMTATLVNGSTVTFPGRLFVLQGNGEGSVNARSNDIWASGDLGSTWHLVAGRYQAVQARGGRANTSFYPILSRPATGIDNRYFIYRIGGLDTNGTRRPTSYLSYDGGQSWIDQSARPGATSFTPARDRASLVVDETDALYLIGGQGPAGWLNSVWRSPSQGFTWEQLPPAPWRGRGTALALAHRSRRLGREVFTYMTGWDGSALQNDVWVSSDLARSWVRLNTTTPFFPRDSANGEITRDGIIVLVAGQSNQNGTEIALNDVYVSMDGGWTWGECVEDAPFSDRRDLLTVFDADGYLTVAGGSNWYATPRSWFNDVWRSSFSFNDPVAVANACGVHVPACGTGLSCWPGSGVSHYPNGSVACPAIRQCAGLPEVALTFQEQTAGASWSGRYAGNVELFPKTVTYTPVGGGTARTVPAGALIMQGGTSTGSGVINNDVWLSSNQGRTWDLIAGYARYANQGGEIRAGGTAWGTSYSPALSETTGIVDEVSGIIYRVGGYLSVNTAARNDVWRSTNAVTWQKMAATNLPVRWGASVVVDGRGRLYVAGGAGEGTAALRDLWVSTNGGATFTQPSATPPPFMTGGRGRLKGFLLHRRSLALSRDVLYAGLGYNNQQNHNDVWVSSDDGVSWAVVTLRAPFPPRDAAGAEITSAGLMVVTGGQTTVPVSESLNDVWVSADGGYTWGECVRDAVWNDRREPSTVFDMQETLYVMGGRQATSSSRLYNDVFRSNLSFSNLRHVQAACSIAIPACGVGLTCWPTASTTRFTAAGGVTCPVLEQCKRGIFPSSTAAPRIPSSTAKPKPPPYDPCDEWPVEDPECPNFVGSTAGAGGGGGGGGMNGWVIGLVVVIGAVVVLGVAWYYWRQVKRQGGSQVNLRAGEEGLMSDMTATMHTHTRMTHTSPAM